MLLVSCGKFSFECGAISIFLLESCLAEGGLNSVILGQLFLTAVLIFSRGMVCI